MFLQVKPGLGMGHQSMESHSHSSSVLSPLTTCPLPVPSTSWEPGCPIFLQGKENPRTIPETAQEKQCHLRLSKPHPRVFSLKASLGFFFRVLIQLTFNKIGTSHFVYRSLLFKSVGKIKIYRLWVLNNKNTDFFFISTSVQTETSLTITFVYC